MARHRLRDLQWECIAELFPSPKPAGRPPTNCREAFDAIRWILRTGSSWRDLPEEFGKGITIYGHYDKRNGDGTLESDLNELR